MRISLNVWGMHPGGLVRMAKVAEQAGFDGLWLGEHVLAPVRVESHHPTSGGSAHQHHASRAIIGLDTELVDPLVALLAVATVTSRLRLATGVVVLPLRIPVLAARAAITLQQVAGGRFRLGVGAGWLKEEFDAVGAPFRGRGARLEECLEVLRLATAGGTFEFHGAHIDAPPVQLTPHHVDVPVVFGGSFPGPCGGRASWHTAGSRPGPPTSTRWWPTAKPFSGTGRPRGSTTPSSSSCAPRRSTP